MQAFQDEHHYPLTAQQLAAQLTDVDFLRRKYAALERSEVTLLAEEVQDAERLIRMRYVEPTDLASLPEIARKLLADKTRVEQTTRWNLQTLTGSVALRPDGPAQMDCQMRLLDEDQGCRLCLDWQVTVKVPMLGGKLEKALVQSMQQKSRRDEQITRQLLAG